MNNSFLEAQLKSMTSRLNKEEVEFLIKTFEKLLENQDLISYLLDREEKLSDKVDKQKLKLENQTIKIIKQKQKIRKQDNKISDLYSQVSELNEILEVK